MHADGARKLFTAKRADWPGVSACQAQIGYSAKLVHAASARPRAYFTHAWAGMLIVLGTDRMYVCVCGVEWEWEWPAGLLVRFILFHCPGFDQEQGSVAGP